jgi:hypothetical protein
MMLVAEGAERFAKEHGNSHGSLGFAFNTPRMAYGYVALDGDFVTSV